MKSLVVVAGVFMAASAIAAGIAAEKPVVVAAVNLKQAAAPSVRPAAASAVKVLVSKETAVPAGSLEAFGAVGLPQ